MEKMTELENWNKNNINGQVAVKLKEIWKRKWESVYMSNDFQQSLIYQGREMSLWLKVTWVDVGDIPDEWDYTYTAYLWNLAVCPDYYEAILQLQEEKWFSLEISDIICFDDCASILWWEYENVKEANEIVEGLRIKDKTKRDKITWWICEDLNNILSQYYVIEKYWRLYLKARNSISKLGVIKKNTYFTEDMKKIKEYFDKKLPEIKKKIETAKIEERGEEEKIKKEQTEKAEDLQNQL